MATQRDLRPGQEGDRLDRVSPGYRLPPDRTVEEILGVYDDLLRSEGIDPTWQGFDKTKPS
jgi:hypothetical protein